MAETTDDKPKGAECKRYARRAVWPTDDNVVAVTITWPHPLRHHEVADLEKYLAIWVNMLKREADKAQRDDSPEDHPHET